MAPNRKNVSGLVQALSSNDLEGLQNAVQPKFLPLTDASESTSTAQQQVAVVVTQKPQSNASYWDWPADAEVQKEEQQDLFSVSRIEANLIKDAAATTAESKQVADHDDYWAEEQITDSSVEQEVVVQEEEAPVVVVRAAQHHHHTAYWEWPGTQKDATNATIQRILADEQARARTSATAMERAESAAANTSTISRQQQVEATKEYNDSYWQWDSAKVASHVADASHPNANYWDWSPEEEEENKKQKTAAAAAKTTIQAILEYEAARELLEASTIVQQLQNAAPVTLSTGGTKASSDDYWAESPQAYGDEYWEWPAEKSASAAAVAATGNQGYWDW